MARGPQYGREDCSWAGWRRGVKESGMKVSGSGGSQARHYGAMDLQRRTALCTRAPQRNGTSHRVTARKVVAHVVVDIEPGSYSCHVLGKVGGYAPGTMSSCLSSATATSKLRFRTRPPFALCSRPEPSLGGAPPSPPLPLPAAVADPCRLVTLSAREVAEVSLVDGGDTAPLSVPPSAPPPFLLHSSRRPCPDPAAGDPGSGVDSADSATATGPPVRCFRCCMCAKPPPFP